MDHNSVPYRQYQRRKPYLIPLLIVFGILTLAACCGFAALVIM